MSSLLYLLFQHRNGVHFSTEKLDELTIALNQEVENNQLMFNDLAYGGYEIMNINYIYYLLISCFLKEKIAPFHSRIRNTNQTC